MEEQTEPTDLGCLAPGCPRVATTRGLCGACYNYTRDGQDPDRRAAIVAVMLPAQPPTASRRKARVTSNRAAPATPPTPTPHAPAPPAADAPETIPLEEARSRLLTAVHEIASSLGLRRINAPDGLYLINGQTGKGVVVEPDGGVYAAVLQRAPHA